MVRWMQSLHNRVALAVVSGRSIVRPCKEMGYESGSNFCPAVPDSGSFGSFSIVKHIKVTRQRLEPRTF